MATSEDVIKFQELSNKDRILCTTRDHTRDLQKSVMVMELVDKIRRIEQEHLDLAGLDSRKNEPLSRSTILLSALSAYKAILRLELENYRELKDRL